MIAENLEEIRQSIAVAATHAGRNADSVSLIAVSKTKPTSMVREAVTADRSILEKIAPRNWQKSMRNCPTYGGT